MTSGSDTRPDSPWRAYVAVALVACATLLYQVATTRILSVVVWYHFAFLSISLAMLGIGAPGVWFAFRPPSRLALPRALVVAGIVLPLSVIVIFAFGGSLAHCRGSLEGVAGLLPSRVLLVVMTILSATLSLGTCVCLLLIEARGRRLGKVYGADLLGATFGAALVVPLMHFVPTPLLVAGSGLLPLAAALVVGRVRRTVAAAAGACLIGLMVWGSPFELHYTKGYAEDQSQILWEKWTPTARLTVWRTPFWTPLPAFAFGWGVGSKFRPTLVNQLWLEQDGSAGTPITELTGPPSELRHLFFDVTAAGYELRPPGRVCVIGAGGGRDVLTALASGARDIDAVELNEHIIDALSGPFRAFSGDVYHLPGVRAVASEGRSYLTRRDERYDMLQISLIDSWAATAAGAFALSENHLYTLEAFRLYLNRLSPRGLLSVSRWVGGERQLEGARLALLARAALEAEGFEKPERHVIVVRGGWVANLLVSRAPFADEDVARVDEIARSRGFTRYWPRPAGTGPGDSPIARVLAEGPGAIEALGVDLSPPTDDRPFFFQMLPVFGGIEQDPRRPVAANDSGVLMLRRLVVVVGVLALGLFFAPFALSRRLERHPRFWGGSLYFAAIGAGFMLVEAGWIQRFILLLGHPSYATTVVLATLLLGAGLGSLVAARSPLRLVRRFAVAVPPLLLGINLALAPAMASALGSAFGWRLAVTVAFVLPAGFFMGFAFPVGMLCFGEGNKAWFWAINGAAGVLASVLSLVLALLVGFAAVVTIGTVCYAGAVALLLAAGGAGEPAPVDVNGTRPQS